MAACPHPVRALAVLLAALLLARGGAGAGPPPDPQALLEARKFAEAADAFSKAWAAAPVDGRRGPALGLAAAVTQGRLADRYGAADEALMALVARAEADLAVRVALGDLRLLAGSALPDAKEREKALAAATAQYEQAVKVAPGEPTAALGLARSWEARGRLDKAAAALDPLLDGTPDPRLQVLKGRFLYQQAHAENQANPGSRKGREGVAKARALLTAAVTADPSSFEGWLTLARCAEQQADLGAAEAAYTRALALDAEDPAPLEGLHALVGDDPEAWRARLEKVAAETPTQVAVQLALGRLHVEAQRWEPAAQALTTFVERSTLPWRRVLGLTPLGLALQGLGKEAEALRAFDEALTADPTDLLAADAFDRRLQATYVDTAQTDLKAAEKAADEYERLLRRTRDNVFVAGNVAFLLREAYARNQADGKWLPILKDALHFYEIAAQVVTSKAPEAVAEAAWHERWAWASVLNDTGHMFQAYEPIRNLTKAEALFLRALELSDHGSYDAYLNLSALYEEQREHRKAYALAGRAAEHLKQEDGSAHVEGRAAAAALRQRLVDEGKVKEEKVQGE